MWLKIGCAPVLPLNLSVCGNISTTQILKGSNSTPFCTKQEVIRLHFLLPNGLRRRMQLELFPDKEKTVGLLLTKTLLLNLHRGFRQASSFILSKNSNV